MNKTAGFIGFGKLGSTLCSAISENNSIHWIVESNEENRNYAQKQFPNVSIFSDVSEIISSPDYIFLTVEDSSIGKTAIEIAGHLKEKLSSSLVLHCSGALPLNILNSCKQYGASTAVIHPYQTFFYPASNLLDGIGWSIRSEDRIVELSEFIISLNGIPVVIPDDVKTISLYHCSAVVASNFLNTLLSTSKDIANLAGIPAENFIPKIVNTTIENNFSGGEKKDFPLTGPYARADLKTIENHINSLKPHRHLLKSYCYFALATIEKLRHDKLFDEKILLEMEKIIKNNLNEK